MLPETDLYSKYIRKHNIKVYPDGFTFECKLVPLVKVGTKWYAGDDDASLTKKSAIYWYIKNNRL